MGGKTKQSQRTKNNVRPSSSGRSAQILSNVKFESGITNATGLELPALFPTLVMPSIDPMVSPEIQLCFKKLNKKDPITKSKALHELYELVSNSNVDDIVAALPTWAHFYKILTADPDRKVREGTQLCHGGMVSLCGRRAAPSLRRLLPAWLQAQHDDHAPAASLANASLAKTFPDAKLPEVIAFCKEEVMTHLIENLTGHGEAAYIRKSDSPEEAAATSARVCAGSLRGLRCCVQRLPSTEDDWLLAALQPLLAHTHFWKRAAHQDDNVRAAWYAAVGALVERFGERFAELYGQRALRVMLAAKENNPLAAAQLWDCLLLFMYNVKEWHKHLDKKELLNKRILDLLENGGWGDGRRLADIVLPVLAQLPPHMLSRTFTTSFFNALFHGLLSKAVLSSKCERQSWITSLDECLRYVSTQQQEYVLELVTSIHRFWLETILAPVHDVALRTNLIKFSAQRMAAMIKYWLKQSKDNHSEKYDQLIRNFWQNVGSMVTAQIDKVSMNLDDIEKLIDGHILLLQTLKTSFLQETKKQYSIKFDDVSIIETEKQDESPRETVPCESSIVDRYYHNLNDVVYKICSHYLEFCSKTDISDPILSSLLSLLIDFDSKKLFTSIANQFDCPSIYSFYDRILRNWLAGDTMRRKSVIDIVFLIVKHLSEEEQDALNDSFKQFPASVVEWWLSLSLSHRSAASRRWLRSALVDATVSQVCARVIDLGETSAKNLLMLCLNKNANGERAVSAAAVQCAVRQLCACVRGGGGSALDACAPLVAAMDANQSAVAQALFSFMLRVHRTDPHVSEHTWLEARQACRENTRQLTPDERLLMLEQAAGVLHQQLMAYSNLPKNEPAVSNLTDEYSENESSIDTKQIEHIASVCPYLLDVESPEDISELLFFTNKVLDLEPTDPFSVELFALRHDIVTSNISCPIPDTDVINSIISDDTQDGIRELSEEVFLRHAYKCIFKAVYLRMLLQPRSEEDGRSWSEVLIREEDIVRHLCWLVRDQAVVCALYDGYAFWHHYHIIEETKTKIESLLQAIIDECSLDTKLHISDKLSELAASEGYYWAFARKYFEDKAKTKETIVAKDSETNENEQSEDKQDSTVENETNEPTKASDGDSFDLERINDIVSRNGYFHIMQANVKGSPLSKSIRCRYLCMLRALYLSHGDDARATGRRFLTDVANGQKDADADVIVNAYYATNALMLYEMDVSSSPWAAMCTNIAAVEYLSALVSGRGWVLPAHHWDFTTISLCSLMCSVEKTKTYLHTTKVTALACAVLRLFRTVAQFVQDLPKNCERQQPSAHVAHLLHEWKDIFAPDLHNNLLTVITHVLENPPSSVTSNHIAVLHSLSSCLPFMAWEALTPAHRALFPPERLQDAALAVMQAPAHRAHVYLAYSLLAMVRKTLVLDDADRLAGWSEESVEKPQLSLERFGAAFRRLRDVVDAALAHIRVCEETCELEEDSEVATLTLSYLLLARAATAQCGLARGELAHHYIQLYRSHKWCEGVLLAALRLLPAPLLEGALETTHVPLAGAEGLFHLPPHLDIYKRPEVGILGAAACGALTASVCGAGAGDARGWRGAAPHRHARTLAALVQGYISPHAIREELTLLQTRAGEVPDTEVFVQWSIGSARCVLTVDERPLELVVTLAPAHPLQPAVLSAPENCPANNTDWLVMYMAYQNGSVLNALKMWTSAVTSKVERSPQCYICYCRLHFASGKLPQVFCYQCRNKFHTACLRKWFKTSSKSKCPLCRSNF